MIDAPLVVQARLLERNGGNFHIFHHFPFASAVEPTPELLSRLRALGYVEK